MELIYYKWDYQIRRISFININQMDYRKNKENAQKQYDWIRFQHSCVIMDEFEHWAINTHVFKWQDEEVAKNNFIYNDKFEKLEAMMHKVIHFNY
jgi:hypothetical protein